MQSSGKGKLMEWILALIVFFSLPLAAGAEPELRTVEEIALYQGHDRDLRLLRAARQEGTLNLYTSINAEDLNKLIGAFEKKYGIKVNAWRASSEKLLQRVIAENNAAKQTWDIVESNGPELESMVREKLAQKVYSPYKKDLIQEAIPKHGEYLPTRLNIFVQAYNKNKVKPDEVPKTYKDLLDPRWKGRLGIEVEDVDWLAGLSKAMGEKEGIAYFKKLSGQNLSKRKGARLVSANGGFRRSAVCVDCVRL